MQSEQSEQSENFNERLSQWVADQGFWFQLRYSLSSSGTRGTALYHLMRIGFRLLIFIGVLAFGTWVYLVKRTEYKEFNLGLTESIQSAVSASEIQLGGFNRLQGYLEISRFAAQGGAKTFYNSMEARNLRCKMGFLDGVAGRWDPGTISISRLDMEIRPGTDDANAAEMFSKALFKQSDQVSIDSLEITSANLRWGYSERTRGAIEASNLRVQRIGRGLKLSFKGGIFSQNWLRKLEIVNLIVICEPEGFVFEKAEFRLGTGSVNLSGLRLLGGENPKVVGVAKVNRLSLESALPVALRSFVEGSISGDFKVTGSTNSSEGIGFEGQVTLDGQDSVILRERLHLLKALSVVDYVRNYYRLDFREGSFKLKSGSGGLEVTDLNLKASDLFTLVGDLKVRPPTAEEKNQALGKSTTAGPLFQADDPQAGESLSVAGQNEITLRKAAQAIKGGKAAASDTGASTLFDRLGQNFETRRLEEQEADRLSKTLRYDGSFVITLLPDAFERAPKLIQQYPADTKTERIPMVIPVQGSLYELTLKQAEDIYQQGTR